MVKLRLKRMGRRNSPFYRLVAIDSRKRRDGREIERLGWYNPIKPGLEAELKEDRVKYWLDQGALPSATVHNLLTKKGINFQIHLEKLGKSDDEIKKAMEEWYSRQEQKLEKVEAKKAARKAAKKAASKPKMEAPAEEAPAEEAPAEEAPEEEAPEEELNNIEYNQVSIFGKKIGMSRVFLDEGDFDCPVTVVSAGPCHVTQLKTVDKEGYNSVQISYEEIKESKASKPMLGHFKKSGAPVSRMLKEFKVEDLDNFTIGAEINVSAFKVGDKVRVVGKSIGRGFAGHMKRHGFGGGRASHGKNSVMRKAGSIGAGSDPSRVWKGTRMAGRMGGDNITIKNLSIVKIDVDNNLLYVSGSVPGANKGLLFISKR